MQGINKFSILIVATCFFPLFADNCFATEISDPSHKIAFLKNGEVWISDVDGQEIEQITSDSGKVDDFLFSPSLKYIAYSKIIGYEEEPGLWDDTENVPQRAVCSIILMEFQTKRVIKEIMPTEDLWIYTSRWLPEGKLLYYSSSGFDVSGFYTYDIRKDSMQEIDYIEGSRMSNTDYSTDGFLKAYVNDSGLGKEYRENLHLVDSRTNVDSILVSKRSISDPKLSNDNKRIAFVEVQNVEKKYFDNLWIYTFSDDSLDILYKGPARAKTGSSNEISWSRDDKYVAMFYSPEALVLDVQNPNQNHRILGTDFSWFENKKIVFAQGNDTYMYSLDTRKSERLFEGAVKPTTLREKDY